MKTGVEPSIRPSEGDYRPKLLRQTADLARGGDHSAADLDQVVEVDLVHRITKSVIVRIESSVGELFGQKECPPAVIEEAGVVAAVLDAQVVSVERRQVELVALDLTDEFDDKRVRTVAVLLVVDVEAVLGVRAVPDHVHLDHADHFKTLRLGFVSEPVGVGVAAPQALLLAREVDDMNSAVEAAEFGNGTRREIERGGAGAVVLGSRSLVLVAPRPAGGGVEVGAEHENLLGVLLAGDDELNVLEILAASAIAPELGGDVGRSVCLNHVAGSSGDAGVMTVARNELSGNATQIERSFAGEMVKHDTHLACIHRSEGFHHSGIRCRQVGGVDQRTRQSRGAALLFLVVLAAAGIVCVTGVKTRILRGVEVEVQRGAGFGTTLIASCPDGEDDKQQYESQECHAGISQ